MEMPARQRELMVSINKEMTMGFFRNLLGKKQSAVSPDVTATEQLDRTMEQKIQLTDSDEAMVTLRSEPHKWLKQADVESWLEVNNVYDGNLHATGRSLSHDYARLDMSGHALVLDRATGLIWQRSGSSSPVAHDGALDYVKKLTCDLHAGYADWRLPTVEEAVSLLESQVRENGLRIDPIFDTEQVWVWTSDVGVFWTDASQPYRGQESPQRWSVSYKQNGGSYCVARGNEFFVRAVRTNVPGR